MKVVATDTFLKSLKTLIAHERWYYKLYEFFRYDLIRFFRNIIRFRKELWSHYVWDSSYNLRLFKRSLELTADYLEKRGYEVESSRNKKIEKIRRVVLLLDNHINDNFIDQAEKELNLVYKTKLHFKESVEHPGSYEMVSDCTQEEEADNKKINDRANEIQAEQWAEIWKILEGQDYSKFIKIEDEIDHEKQYDNWDKQFDGSGCRSWWD